MTKLKQEYMFNHNGKNWVILDDFMALKEKLKKTQKEYAKARNQLNEANEAIDEAYWDCYREGFEPNLATEYRKKYGLNANDDKYK